MHVWRSMPARTASAHAWHLFWCQGIMTRRWASSRNRELVKNSRLPPRQITSMLLGKPQFLHLRTLVTSCACAGPRGTEHQMCAPLNLHQDMATQDLPFSTHAQPATGFALVPSRLAKDGRNMTVCKSACAEEFLSIRKGKGRAGEDQAHLEQDDLVLGVAEEAGVEAQVVLELR